MKQLNLFIFISRAFVGGFNAVYEDLDSNYIFTADGSKMHH